MVLVHFHREADTTGSPTAGPWECCPRTVLAHALRQLEEEAGVSLMAGFEVEFNLFQAPQPGATGLPAPIENTVYCETGAFDTASTVLQQICAVLEELGQQVEQVHAESGPGQYEIATRYSPALEAADALVFRKETICSVARRNGMAASFLPKIWADQAGSGCHVHLSLVDAVTGDPAMGDDSRPHGLSALGEAFATGVLRHLPALLPFTAGNPNSYHRIAPSTWSGAFRCWGVNNREAPLRLVGAPGCPNTVNFEYKAVDGTANPYLALAAIITAGLCGIRGGYTLPEPVFGDPAGVDGHEPLPGTLEEALAALEANEEFRAALVGTLGSETLCRVYPIIKRNECTALSGLSVEEQADKLWSRF